MTYSQAKNLLSNPGEACFWRSRYVIYNEFGPIAVVHANCEQDAFDSAADSGHLDGQSMSDEDFTEYDNNGWQDSFILAGNASEPFWSEYLSIREQPAASQA